MQIILVDSQQFGERDRFAEQVPLNMITAMLNQIRPLTGVFYTFGTYGKCQPFSQINDGTGDQTGALRGVQFTDKLTINLKRIDGDLCEVT